MEVFIGTILPFGFNFPPKNWALCAGQTMAISQNAALFSLLGTYYGGNGQTTFQLPDLQGRMPIGMGNGAGLTPRTIGEVSGTENVTLTTGNMPTHSHPTTASAQVQVCGVATAPANAPSGTNNYLGAGGAGPASATIWSNALNTPVAMAGVSTQVDVGVAGGNQPVGVMNPFLAVNFSIALFGIFPSRN
jgi:microcystin-dependent protein